MGWFKDLFGKKEEKVEEKKEEKVEEKKEEKKAKAKDEECGPGSGCDDKAK